MKARYLLSMLAAIACPAVVSAQAPEPRPDGPPPDRREARPPGDRPGSPDGRREEFRKQNFGHHRHLAKHDGDGRPGDPRERMVHIMEAAHHLRAAGMNEMADNLESQARKMREEFAERGRGDRDRDGRPDGMRDRNGDGRPDGRGGRGNFASPQGAPDIRGQLERIMKDVQELRQEVRRMKAERGGQRPESNGPGPRNFRPPFQGPQGNNPPGPEGDRRRGEHRDGVQGNESPHGRSAPPQGGPRGDRPPGPGPQANGPQNNDRPPFPRPEWRDHDGAKKPDGGRGDRGDKRDGPRPPGPPQGDRPNNEPAAEGAIPDGVAPPPPAPAPENPPAPPVQ